MGFLSEPTHWILILVLLLVLFGAKRLPELGKGLGEGLKGFKEGMKGITDPAPATAAAPAAPATPAAPAGKSNYKCPNCKNTVTASVPNPNATEDFGFCPECGGKFDKKLAVI